MEKVIVAISNFIDVKEEEIQLLQKYFHFFSFKKNEVIIREGQIAEKIGFIIKGSIRSFYFNEKEVEQTVGFEFENSLIVDFDTFFQQIPLKKKVITLEPSDVIWISRSDFGNFIKKFPRYEAVLRLVLTHDIS